MVAKRELFAETVDAFVLAEPLELGGMGTGLPADPVPRLRGRGEGGVRGSLRWQPNATKHPALGDRADVGQAKAPETASVISRGQFGVRAGWRRRACQGRVEAACPVKYTLHGDRRRD